MANQSPPAANPTPLPPTMPHNHYSFIHILSPATAPVITQIYSSVPVVYCCIMDSPRLSVEQQQSFVITFCSLGG